MTRNIPGTLTLRALTKLHESTDSAALRRDALKLIDRAKYSLERGWTAAALDALKRAVQALEDTP